MELCHKEGKETVEEMPPTLKVFVSGHCPNCQEARRLAREIVASYPGLTVHVVNLDVTTAPENPDVFAVPTYVLNDEVICLGNPRQSWLEQQIDDLMNMMHP